jgi:hypothetical protein
MGRQDSSDEAEQEEEEVVFGEKRCIRQIAVIKEVVMREEATYKRGDLHINNGGRGSLEAIRIETITQSNSLILGTT